MTFGEMFLGNKIGSSKEDSKLVFDKYVEAGGNFFDTANTYADGQSEAFLGEFMKGKRDNFVVATKYTNNLRMVSGDPNAGGNSRKSLMQSLEKSLKNLQTDYIDLFYIHYWDFTTPPEEIMMALNDVVRAGKVLYIGVSDCPAWRVAEMNTIAKLRGWPQFIGMQTSYSLVERTSEHDVIPMAQALGLGVLPWSPLGSGVLSGKYLKENQGKSDASSGRALFVNVDKEKKLVIAQEVADVAKEINKSSAQVALNWVVQRKGVTSTIIGARTVAQLEDNLGALGFTLSKEHMERLDKISAIDAIFPHSFLNRDQMRIMCDGVNLKVERK